MIEVINSFREEDFGPTPTPGIGEILRRVSHTRVATLGEIGISPMHFLPHYRNGTAPAPRDFLHPFAIVLTGWSATKIFYPDVLNHGGKLKHPKRRCIRPSHC
jgi:hypothetical protein